MTTRTARVGAFQSVRMNLTKRLAVIAGVCAIAASTAGTASAALGPNELLNRSVAAYEYFCENNHDAQFYSDWVSVQGMSPMRFPDNPYAVALIVTFANYNRQEEVVGIPPAGLNDETHRYLCSAAGQTAFTGAYKSVVERQAIGLDPAYTTEASLNAFAEKKLAAIEAVITAEENRHG
jgi:hypothetical protein